MLKTPEWIVKGLITTHRFIKSGDVSPKVKKLLMRYNISYGERIVAHLLKTGPLDLLLIDGIVFTEKAIYINPKHCKNKASNRIPYDRLCQYVILHAGDKEPIFLMESLNNRRTVFEKAILDAAAGNELTDFLVKLQQQIIGENPDSLEIRNRTVQSIFTECKSLIKYSGLSVEAHLILERLFAEEPFCADAVALASEDIARKGSDYRAYIASLPPDIPLDLRNNMLDSYNSFIESFISDLQDFSCDTSANYLEEVLKNWQNDPAISDNSLFLRGLLCARTLHFTDLDTIVYTMLDLNIDAALVQRLRLYRGVCANQAMREVFAAIQNNKKISGNLLELSDSMGLTPLHYALILRQDKVVKQLLTAKEWTPVFTEQDAEVKEVYDYINLAKFVDSAVIDNVIGATDDVMKIYQNAQKAIEKRNSTWSTTANIAMNFIQEGIIGSARSSRYNNGYLNTLESFSGSMGQVASEASDLCGEAVRRMQIEMAIYTEQAFFSADATVKKWADSERPLISYLLRLYSDPELLHSVLNEEIQNFELYHLNHFYFAAPADAGLFSEEIDVSEEPPEEESGEIIRPHRDSWFSPEARFDSSGSAMIDEFQELVKEYQPTLSTSEYSRRVFQDILDEYISRL